MKKLSDSTRLFLFFVFLYLFTMGGHLYSPDAEVMFRTTEAMVENRTAAIEPLQGFATQTGQDGREYGQYGIGQPILAIPFYLVGKCISAVADRSFLFAFRRDTIQYHEMTLESYSKRLGVSMFNTFVTAFMAVVIFWIILSITGDRFAGLCCALLFGTCTEAWVHARSFFSEPSAALALLLSFHFVLRKPAPKFLLAGIFSGLALLIRVDSVVALPAVGLFVLWTAWKRAEKKKAPFLMKSMNFTIPILIAIGLIAAFNYYRFGALGSTGYEDQEEGVQFVTPFLVGAYGLLFGAGKGLFIYSPVLILLLWSVPRFMKKYSTEGLAILGIFLGFLLLMSKWQNWAGGWCWGPRHIYQVQPFLIIPLAVLFSERKGRVEDIWIQRIMGLGWAGLIVASLVVQTLGFSASFMDAMQPLTETERYMSLWVPNFTLPALHWQLIAEGRTDLWWVYFLRAPLGLWKLLALLPPLGIIAFGIPLFQSLSSCRKDIR